MEGKAMDALPWQCSGAFIIVSSGFSHKKRTLQSFHNHPTRRI